MSTSSWPFLKWHSSLQWLLCFHQILLPSGLPPAGMLAIALHFPIAFSPKIRLPSHSQPARGLSGWWTQCWEGVGIGKCLYHVFVPSCLPHWAITPRLRHFATSPNNFRTAVEKNVIFQWYYFHIIIVKALWNIMAKNSMSYFIWMLDPSHQVKSSYPFNLS